MNERVKQAIDRKRGPDDPDFCVMCGEDTPEYKMSTHIDDRRNYIEGMGQVCAKCAVKHGIDHRG
ncbi:MAG: hypothetical protein UW46_C0007G0023 [Candidatus Yanofskybacteria bacterium GW2011_GWF1_44_227]|uniref:Uncharacterized protein n=1 Tax=Candidatus Yanofskybacteria bacterium GW2011_GWE2_40_11 TaxID=1619033 RepID=A0A0G0QHZ5_9BACT|nr:MAG: hypothetical protein UT69_C0014G0003 [Candidatus Yanofskybacteria bacterium GW2011_GWE1_40_10]KKR39994.1 MAG: hypothetical protein UT75_C0011G0022 [Candidatus Yanofskybacteria bacterium GW2011_GWE2_40_11]KKT15363.1 MAG: hypothetical protein UV97_C0008G0012 [Candidatus Yanofskybacteria bacterium GW2011_GWF2_43_596]KKT53047.1 MAG: hypothetical protein UW46_C0007G0023 [Candidatus Yanofskybacteria bacterium GW2011_GWF1_44_227]OGN35729.1 MAG: hypothetical protein A2241_02490 [Candidatus Yano